MATNPPGRQTRKPERSVIQWLLDSDPSIRWQVMRDLPHAPAKEVAAERARVATEGWGQPSRWNTLRALRVLDWYSTRDWHNDHEGNMTTAIHRLLCDNL